MDVELTEATGEPVYKSLPYAAERPELSPIPALIFILVAVLIGTALLFLIMRFKKLPLWKAWYFLSVFVTLTIALAAFIPQSIAALISAAAAVMKVKKPNVILHNLTEMLIYGGLAAIFVPLLNIFAAAFLLIAISLYDAFAVWKSKHMVKLAKFQTSSGLFAGLALPYKRTFKEAQKKTAAKSRSAILGGGDMGFPLMFAGTVMAQVGFYKALLIPLTATIALSLLFLLSKKGRFYPAMPFLAAGCFIGYGIAMSL
jgi:presenilin-like A22 family membrane protease